MKIAVLKERRFDETRVAATPETVKKLKAAGHTIVVQRGAGHAANYPDAQYEQAGATVVDNAYTGSQIVLKVRAPQGDEIAQLAAGTRVIGMFDPHRNPDLDRFASQGVSVVTVTSTSLP